MAVPKRKTSKGRRDRRRSHHKVNVAKMVICKTCGAKKLPHTVCVKCGKYDQ